MKKTIFLFIIMLSFQSFSKSREELIIRSIHDAIKKRDPSFTYEKMVETTVVVKSKKKKSKKKKKKSGQDKINDLLAKSREKLKDYQKKMKKKKKSKKFSLKDEYKNSLKALKGKVDFGIKDWKKLYKKNMSLWKKDKNAFLKNLSKVKDNLMEVDEPIKTPKKKLKKKITREIIAPYFLVKGSAQVPIRNQMRRPTCSSFSGIRGMEILLSQQDQLTELSEQYFYWSSKPDCRKKKCSSKGSWIGYGLEYSQKSKKPNIPSEKSCPYKSTSISKNETQIPLKSGCKSGKVKIKKFSYLDTLDELIKTLEMNIPVAASLVLSPNFYANDGLITKKDATGVEKKIDHSKGHSVLVIGFQKLPEKIKEGRYCFIIANSWGLGWGVGGHGCVTEEWIRTYRRKSPFVAISSIDSAF